MSLNVGTLQATLGLDSKPFEAGAAEAVEKGGASLGAFGRLAETAGVEGAGMFSNGLSGLTGDLAEIGLSGGAMLAAGIAVGAAVLVGVAYEMGEEFHQAFATLQTDTGATGDKLEALKEQVTTVFADVPNSIMEVAQAVGVLEGRLGGSAPEVGELADQVLKLTNAFGGDVESNAQSFADVMGRWSVPVGQGVRVINELAAASEASAIPVQTLMQQVANGAPDFQLLGMSIEQATAWVAAFAKTGGDSQALFQGVNHSVAALATINQQNATQAASNAKQAISDAQAERTRIDAIASAWQGVTKANQQAATAQKAIAALLSGGIERAVTDGRNQIADATDGVVDAETAWIKSKTDLDDLLKGPSESDEAKARLKVQQATDAVAASLTAEAKAQNDLSDAQTHGVTGTDLAALQDALASATSGVTQAQLDQQDSQQALADLQPGSAKSLAAIAAAQQQVTESGHKLSDAQAGQADTQAQLLDQLGPQMDGTALLQAAQQQLADAHDQVAQALDGVRQASQKQVSQQQTEAVGTDALGGHYSATNKVLAQLGLTHASVADQTAGLNKWLLTTGDSTDRLQVAMEAEGTRAGVKLSSDIGRAQKAHEDMANAVDHSTGTVDHAAAEHESAGDRIAKAWHGLSDGLAPVFEFIEGLVADLTGDLDKAVTWWETDGVPRFKNGLSDLAGGFKQIGHDIKQWTLDIKQWIVDGWNDVFGFVTNIPAWIGHLLQKMWHGVSDAAGDVWSDVMGAWDSVWGWIDSIPGKVAGGLHGMWDGIKDEFETVIKWLFGKWNDLADFLGFNLPALLGGGHIQLLPHLTVPKFHSGGLVPGAPGSDVPAILQAGETVRTGAQEAALQGALSVGGGVPGITIENKFYGPVAQDSIAWVSDQVTAATKRGIAMHIKPSAVRQ